MKEVLGIFAAIAAVAGIAAAVSKDDDKKDAEQRQREQELELEERRLTVEAAQRKHIQQMEQQRMQMEWEKRNYQMKLANAPKKPVYKTVASLQCPLCMGHREVNEAAGEVHCPYCGANEQLEIDHYEIDQVAFQKQLQEEEQQRAAQEKLRQRNERLNTAIMIVAVIMVITFLILLFSPIVGIAFFTPPFLLFCFLLYKRYPENGGKVWNAIKIPLTCIFVFPLPLTALFMGSEKMEERFSKKARIGMSIGAWAVYAALICVLGGLYVKGFKNAVNQTEITQYEVTESSESEQGTQKSTAQQQSQNKTTTKNTSEQTTSTSNEDDIQIPGEQKEQLEYFDTSTNTVVNIGGVSFSIPSIWCENEEQKSETSHFFTDNNGKIRIGSLGLYSYKIQSNATTIEELKVEYQKYRDGFLKASLRTMPSNLPLYGIEYHDITGYFTFASGIVSKQVNNKDIEVDCYLTILYNPVDHQFITIVMSELKSSKESYLNDYAQIIDSVTLSNDEEAYHTEVSDSNSETTASSEITAEPEPEIYPQEDAFRAAVVAITNSLATDVFTNDGSRHDVSKYHSFSDTSAFYMSVLSQGTWTEKNNNTWHVDGLRLQPDGYDVVFNTPINFDTIAKVSLDVTFDGSNYIISNISGIYAIPGKEDIGTNLSYLNSDSMSKSALTVSANMIASGR